MPLFERGASRRSQSGEATNGNGASTDTGDAYWYWDPIEVDPLPLEQGLSDLVPLDQQLKAVDIALASFGTPYSKERRAEMRAAWREVMLDEGTDTASGQAESSTDK